MSCCERSLFIVPHVLSTNIFSTKTLKADDVLSITTTINV